MSSKSRTNVDGGGNTLGAQDNGLVVGNRSIFVNKEVSVSNSTSSFDDNASSVVNNAISSLVDGIKSFSGTVQEVVQGSNKTISEINDSQTGGTRTNAKSFNTLAIAGIAGFVLVVVSGLFKGK